MSIELYNRFKRYLGAEFFISQANGDQGDSCNRLSGLYFCLKAAGYEKDYAGRLLEVGLSVESDKINHGAGIYSRSPDKKYWGYKIDNLSRDQKEMLQLSFALIGLKHELKECIFRTLFNFGFHQNTRRGTDDPQNRWKMPDFMAPRELACLIRGLDLPFCGLPLILIDLSLLYSVITRKPDNWDRDHKLSLNLMLSVIKKPTFISKFAFKKYIMTNWKDRIYNYFRETDGMNGLLPLAELYEEAINKVAKEYL